MTPLPINLLCCGLVTLLATVAIQLRDVKMSNVKQVIVTQIYQDILKVF